MTVKELYERLSERYPAAYSAEWDHDGLLCCPDPDVTVRRVLCTLDVTEAAVEAAIAGGANVILSHHPLIFHPLAAVTAQDPVGRRVIRLIGAGISHLAFHTRADAAPGGVNDLLAKAVGLDEVLTFADGLGRIGTLPASCTAEAFAAFVAKALGAPTVILGDAGRPVRRVAVLGGSGKSEIGAAIAAGADTFLSGRLSYESINEARELGINLLEAGHFYTEALLPRHLADELVGWGLETEYFDSCAVRVIGHNTQ